MGLEDFELVRLRLRRSSNSAAVACAQDVLLQILLALVEFSRVELEKNKTVQATTKKPTLCFIGRLLF